MLPRIAVTACPERETMSGPHRLCDHSWDGGTRTGPGPATVQRDVAVEFICDARKVMGASEYGYAVIWDYPASLWSTNHPGEKVPIIYICVMLQPFRFADPCYTSDSPRADIQCPPT